MPSGARNRCVQRIFTEIGINRIKVILLNFPVIKDNPQRSSTVFTSGIKYPEALIPSLKSFMFPVKGGSGNKCKK